MENLEKENSNSEVTRLCYLCGKIWNLHNLYNSESDFYLPRTARIVSFIQSFLEIPKLKKKVIMLFPSLGRTLASESKIASMRIRF